MSEEEFYSRALSFDEVGIQVDIFEKEKRSYKKEIERLNNIIKEAREYIEKHTPSDIGICGNKIKKYYTLGEDSVDHILEILDKGENND